MRIEDLTAELVRQHKNEITQLYFDNVRSNQFHDHYTWEEAEAKIDGLIVHLENGTAIVYSAFDEEEIIGFIWAYVHQFREETRMYVSEIRVKEEYRKRGIGSRLLELVEEKARELNLPAIYLHAEANNLNSMMFYADNGYVKERIQYRKEIS